MAFKSLTCFKSPSHRMFYRKMLVQGISLEMRDENDQPLDVEGPKELDLVRRITGAWCLTCDSEANVHLPF